MDRKTDQFKFRIVLKVSDWDLCIPLCHGFIIYRSLSIISNSNHSEGSSISAIRFWSLSCYCQQTNHPSPFPITLARLTYDRNDQRKFYSYRNVIEEWRPTLSASQQVGGRGTISEVEGYCHPSAKSFWKLF